MGRRSFLRVFSTLVLAAAFCGLGLGVNLSLGDVNVVVITDDHSWVGGHGAHESLDIDYGHVLSFYEHLVKSAEKDIFLIHNGDFIDGTGLSTYPPVHLEPILLKMPWDAVTVGNHDVYKSETVLHMSRTGGFIEKLGGRYLTSNVIDSQSGEPLGQRFRYLKGNHTTVLTFGFIYNLEEGIGSPLVKVEPVEVVVKHDWFQNSLRKHDYDAILVMAHMGTDDPSIQVLLSAVRNGAGSEMPVQFITGHTHHRRFLVLDDWSTALEAGCYLDTVGIVSFPTKQTVLSTENSKVSNLFHHDFLDATVNELKSRLGIDTLQTEKGQELTQFIHKTQQNMGLSEVIGCSPRRYYLNRPLYDDDSLFGLWTHHVIPTQFIRNDTKRLVLQGKSSSFRYDLFEGNVTLDDLMVASPFNDSMYLIAGDVPTANIVKLDRHMNRKRNQDLPGLPDFILIGNIDQHETHDLYTLEYEVPFIQSALEEIGGRQLKPVKVNAFATSIWQSFVERHWKNCSKPDISSGSKDTETKAESNLLFGVSKTHVGATIPSASPGTVATIVAFASGISACILLARFILMRLPFRLRSEHSHKHVV
jgi:2',3'-cyclic-nucleotide 2'-phosphodiesterase (5'-nucleotidase family)